MSVIYPTFCNVQFLPHLSIFSVKIYFSFSFCSDFNLEATAVKRDDFIGLTCSNNCLLPVFSELNTTLIINNYHIVHQKNVTSALSYPPYRVRLRATVSVKLHFFMIGYQ